jgi:hypothetical protein
MNVHIVAPSFRDKMEHLGELQWIRTVVDLEWYDRRGVIKEKLKSITVPVTTHHEQASHAYDEGRQTWGRRLCVARRHFMLHFLEG